MKGKAPTPFHTSKSKVAAGNYYGEGIKNPVPKIRESQMMNTKSSSKSKGKAPKSLA